MSTSAPRPGWFEPLRTRWQTPPCSVVLFMLLLYSLAWISQDDEWSNESTVGRFVRQTISTSARTTGPRANIDDRYFIWVGGEAIMLTLEEYVSDPRVAVAEKKGQLVWMGWMYRDSRQGWWALTRNVHREVIRVHNFRGSASLEQLDEAKQLFIAIDPRYAPAANGTATHVQIRWGGVALDVATFLDVIALVYSLGWYRRVLVGRRSQRRIARGTCPRCKYDLSGLPAHGQSPIARCPECGEALSTKDE